MLDPEIRGFHHMRISRYQSKVRHDRLLIFLQRFIKRVYLSPSPSRHERKSDAEL
jgi:hypothetical protein